MSTGKAIADHLRSWSNGTLSGTHVSMALPSNGEYGVPQGVFFSFPVSNYSVIRYHGHCKIQLLYFQLVVPMIIISKSNCRGMWLIQKYFLYP